MKKVYINAALAAFAAGAGAFFASVGHMSTPSSAAFAAAGWGAFRVAAGVVARLLSRPFPVDM